MDKSRVENEDRGLVSAGAWSLWRRYTVVNYYVNRVFMSSS
jgi:hypothetical protein